MTVFLLIIVLLLILGAEFVNGWTDAANAIATVVSTRVLSPKKAVMLATSLNILGTFSGTAVAETIGRGIIHPDMVTITTLAASMISIITWSTIAWRWGLPTSESHALVSGLAGSAIASNGFGALEFSGWQKVGIGLGVSTFLGFSLAFLIFRLIMVLFARTPISKARRLFGKLQIFSAAFVAFGHGSNDGQKFMGAFALALFITGMTKEFSIPFWVVLLCACTMGIGTICGGWRIIKTMGGRLARLEPQHGFAAETAAATAIEVASRLGIPLSTTHTISAAIMGVGSSQPGHKVRWAVVKDIVGAWIFTFPVCGLLSFAITKIVLFIFQS